MSLFLCRCPTGYLLSLCFYCPAPARHCIRTVCLPNLANDKKAGYLNKMVEEEELEPRRVLDRVNKNLSLIHI